MMINFLSLCLGMHLFLLHIWKATLLDRVVLADSFYLLIFLCMSFHFFLTDRVFLLRSLLQPDGGSFVGYYLFSLLAFKIYSSSLTFDSFIIMSQRRSFLCGDNQVFFQVHGLVYPVFFRFRKCSAIISLNKPSAPSSLSSALGTPIALMLPFLMESDSSHRISSLKKKKKKTSLLFYPNCFQISVSELINSLSHMVCSVSSVFDRTLHLIY